MADTAAFTLESFRLSEMYSCIDWSALSILFLQLPNWLTLALNTFLLILSTEPFLLSLLPSSSAKVPDYCGLYSKEAGSSWLMAKTSFWFSSFEITYIYLITSFGHYWIRWLEYLSTRWLILFTILSNKWKNMRKYLFVTFPFSSLMDFSDLLKSFSI